MKEIEAGDFVKIREYILKEFSKVSKIKTNKDKWYPVTEITLNENWMPILHIGIEDKTLQLSPEFITDSEYWELISNINEGNND